MCHLQAYYSSFKNYAKSLWKFHKNGPYHFCIPSLLKPFDSFGWERPKSYHQVSHDWTHAHVFTGFTGVNLTLFWFHAGMKFIRLKITCLGIEKINVWKETRLYHSNYHNTCSVLLLQNGFWRAAGIQLYDLNQQHAVFMMRALNYVRQVMGF